MLQVLESISASDQPQLYTTVFHILRKICVKYGDIPDSLLLPEDTVQINDNHKRPWQMGGYADIYLGRWRDQPVCIKALRTGGNNTSSSELVTMHWQVCSAIFAVLMKEN